MTHLFQFYKKHWRIPKKYYTTETREAFQHWDSKMESQVGYIDGDKLFLPIDQKNTFQLRTTSAIILQDIVGYDSSQSILQLKQNTDKNKLPDWLLQHQLTTVKAQHPELATFNNQKMTWNFELFSIRKKENDQFEIFLNYGANRFFIGEPERDDHKLFQLKKNEPINISINGKSDFSMTGRRDRNYSEYEYIIEYLGEIETVDFLEQNKIKTIKRIPTERIKHIDLRKVLF
jgi:hypothetical protein